MALRQFRIHDSCSFNFRNTERVYVYISDLKYPKHKKLTGESSGVMQVQNDGR